MDLSKGITIRAIILFTLLAGTDSFGSDFMFPFPHRSTISTAALTVPAETNSPPRTPIAPWGKLMGEITKSYTYETMATDPDGDMVKYTFDWGDGTNSTTGYVASGTYANLSHQWPWMESGTSKMYNITAMATDIYGAKSALSQPLRVAMRSPYVNYRPSTPVLTGPTQGVSGTPYNFTVVSTDENVGDTIKYLISWGDDSSTETALFPSGQPVTVSHTWNIPAGQTWNVYIVAMAIDQYLLANNDSSEPLILIMRGPSATTSTSSTTTTRITTTSSIPTTTSSTRLTTTSTTSSSTSSSRTTTISSTPSSTSSTRTTTTSTTSSSSITTPHKAGDANSDGHVDYEDLIILASSYGRFYEETGFDQRADFDGNGEIGYEDLIMLATAYGA